MQGIKRLEVKDAHQAVKAMQTLCLRKSGLERVWSKLNQADLAPEFWQQNVNDILSDLDLNIEDTDAFALNLNLN